MSLPGVELAVRHSLFVVILLLEIYGSFVIVLAANRVFIHFLRTTRDGVTARINLAGQLAFGLEFLLASEIIRTVVVRQWEELQVLAAVLAIRGALAILIFWEMKQDSR